MKLEKTLNPAESVQNPSTLPEYDDLDSDEYGEGEEYYEDDWEDTDYLEDGDFGDDEYIEDEAR